MPHIIVNVHGLTADDVTCRSYALTRRGWVDLGPDVTIHGTIAELRAIAIELDRQLAQLEVDHRIDQVVKCGTCDGTGEVVGDIIVCPDCEGTGQ